MVTIEQSETKAAIKNSVKAAFKYSVKDFSTTIDMLPP